MHRRLIRTLAAALLLMGLATSAEVNAQACLVRGAVTGDRVAIEVGMDVFWLQGMTLTVKRFDEFFEPVTYGPYICGSAKVLLPPALIPPGSQPELLIYAGTHLNPGTRLRLPEYDRTVGFVPHCAPGEVFDTCWVNGSYFRTAEVLNRQQP